MAKSIRSAYLLFFVVLLCCSSPVFGQQGTTSLHGTVTDPEGSAIAGASVTLENKSRGFKAEKQTAQDGSYEFLQLPPATYELTVSSPGFKTVVQSPLVLQVATPMTVNPRLPISSITETINVSGASAPAINTTDATIGNAFNAKQIEAIPSEGRNPVELLSLQPGVSYVGNEVDVKGDSRGGAVNGARSDQTNLTVDGLDNNDQLLGNAFTGVIRVPLDALEEFRVTTTSSNADSGRSSGAQVALITKSGTNQFHGAGYEFNRSLIGAANDWFNKHAQLTHNRPNRPGKLIRNTFGGGVGGPIVKNRLFFYAHYEAQRSRETQQVTQSVPSPNLRKGIVSYECNLTDPKCAPGTPGVSPTPLADGNLLVTLQPSDIKSFDQGCLKPNPITPSCPAGNGPSQGVLDLWNGLATLPNGTPIPAYPLPNTPFGNFGDGVNLEGFTFAGLVPKNENTYLVRLDYNLTQNGNHRLFLRGGLQNDRTLDTPEFPGLPPSQVLHDNSKGIFAGYTAVIGGSFINSIHYGFSRQGLGQDGQNPYSYVSFGTSPADQVSFQRTVNVNVPVHQILDDVTWTHGKHTVQFGGNWRLINNNRFSNEQNLIVASPHPLFYSRGGIANTGQDLDPAISGVFPSVDPSFASAYDTAITDVAGVFGSISATYNQLKSGPLPIGALVPRHFKAQELEFYGQDAWRATPNLTFTLGLRYSLLQPPYETAGNQVAPVPDIGSFFENRAAAMQIGQTYRPVISFDLAGQANGRNPYWNWDYKDIAPRFAVAYSPNVQSGLFHAIFGAAGKSSIRAGYGIYYDHFGQGIVNSFDRQGSLGLSTFLENPAGLTTTNCATRFIALTMIPTGNGCPATAGGPPVPELSPRRASGFPYTPPGMNANGAFAIGYAVDPRLKTPYSYAFDLSITRELPHQFVLEMAYVGRIGHRLLQEVDLAQPLNIRDPASGMTYFQAATMLAQLARSNTPVDNIPVTIPYWENLFPAAAGTGKFSCTDSGGNNAPCSPTSTGVPASPTATQNIYDLYFANFSSETTALQSLDTQCVPACSTLGPFAYYHDQLSSAYSWSSIGHSNYNALEAILRHHVGGLQFDLNYTFSKSIDMNSNAERVSEYEFGTGSASAVAFSGQTVNAWSPFQFRAVSDFDTTHQFNANWVYDLPFGRGKRWAADSSAFVNALLGDWEFSGLYRWTSGYPFSITTSRFPTNFQQDSKAILIGPAPRTGTFFIPNTNNPSLGADPNVFAAGAGAASAFRFAYPGEAGQRNNFRGPGYFGIDMSLAKTWRIREGQALRFTWDVFNVTNSVRFDVGSLSNILISRQSLGQFSQTLTKPRVMQFGLRFQF
jgi:hypothetical protein